jgi:hypothetical protein
MYGTKEALMDSAMEIPKVKTPKNQAIRTTATIVKSNSPFGSKQLADKAVSSPDYSKKSRSIIELPGKAESSTGLTNYDTLGIQAASAPGRVSSYPKAIVHGIDLYSKENRIQKAAIRIKQEIFRVVFPLTNGIPPAKTKLAIFFIAPSCNGKSTLKKGFDPDLFLKIDHSHKIASVMKRRCESADHIKKENFIRMVESYEAEVFLSPEFQKFCSIRLPDIIEKEPLQKEDSIQSKLAELKAVKHKVVIESFASTGSNIMIDLRATNMNNIRAQKEQLSKNRYTCICVSPVVGDNEELERRWKIRNDAENKKDSSDLVCVLEESKKFKETGHRELERIFDNKLFVVQTDAKKNVFEIIPQDNLQTLGFT